MNMSQARSIFDSVEHQPIENIVDVLRLCDDAYHNGKGEPPLSDTQYDTLRQYLMLADPTNPFLIGVGSDVRGGKVDLPFKMGSLNQVQVGEINQWVQKHKLQDNDLIVSDKMDGTSVMIVYDINGDPQIAYSRGNGVQGADISRHIFKIANVPNKVSGRMVVRAEVIMSETNFQTFKHGYKRSGGQTYANARNAVAGLMNGKHTHASEVYTLLEVIAYELICRN